MSRLPERAGGGWRALFGVGRRSELAVSTVVAAVLAVAAFAAVAAPRSLTRAEASSLSRAIDQAPPSDRRLTIRVIDEFSRGFDDDPLEDQREQLDAIAARIDDDLLARYGPPRFMADTSRFLVRSEHIEQHPDGAESEEPPSPALPTFLTMRVHPDLDDHSRLVEGREARRTDREVGGLRVFEIELTPQSAAELGWALGELAQLTTDASDPVTRQFNGGLPDDFLVELVGLRALDPVEDPYWAGDERLHRPTVADTGTGATVFAFAIMEPSQLPARPFAVRGRSPFALEQRRDLVEDAIDLGATEDTLAGLIALDAAFADQPTLTRPGVVAGLGPVLQVEADQRQTARSTLVLAAVGVFGVVLTTLAQLLLASFGRRRGWITVARARGASGRQVIAGAAAEMVVVATVAVVVGGGIAALAFRTRRSALELMLLAGLWLGAIATAALLATAEAHRPVTVAARSSVGVGLGRWARLGGVLLVVVAIAAVVTFRRRGLSTDSPSVDLLAILLPVLVPLAVAYASRWLLPAVLRHVARRGLRLGPGRLVGLRRVVATPATTAGLTTVLLLALTVAALGIGADRSLERGAVDASWAAVGAPFRIETREDAVADAVRALPGAIVSASGSTRINVASGDTTASVQFITVDLRPLRALTEGTVADGRYPESLDAPELSGRIAIVAAERVGGRRIRVGSVFDGVGGRTGQEFVVVETRREAFGRSSDWLLADRSAYALATGAEPSFNSLAIGVPEDQRPALQALADGAGDRLAARADVLTAQLDDPLSRAVRVGYLVAGLVAVLVGLLGLVAVGVVTARQRRREVAILGLLGSSRGEIARAVVSELVPAAVAGVVTGTVVGWLVVRSFDGRFDLSSFAAGVPVSIRPDLPASIAVGLVVAAVAVALIVVLVRRIVHAPVREILRIEGAE